MMPNGPPFPPLRSRQKKQISSGQIVQTVAILAAFLGLLIVSINQGDAIKANRGNIKDINNHQEQIDMLQVEVCRNQNYEHKIISAALTASLTEEDVQANPAQREAYEKIVRKFAEPKDCTPSAP